jgi:hypothetical protein
MKGLLESSVDDGATSNARLSLIRSPFERSFKQSSPRTPSDRPRALSFQWPVS